MVFLQGPMLCIVNCWNEKNGLMETCWVLDLYLSVCATMQELGHLKVKKACGTFVDR